MQNFIQYVDTSYSFSFYCVANNAKAICCFCFLHFCLINVCLDWYLWFMPFLIFARCYLVRFWHNAVYIELMVLIDLTMKQEIWSFSAVQLCFMSFLRMSNRNFHSRKEIFLYYSWYIWSQTIEFEDQLYVSHFKLYTVFRVKNVLYLFLHSWMRKKDKYV